MRPTGFDMQTDVVDFDALAIINQHAPPRVFDPSLSFGDQVANPIGHPVDLLMGATRLRKFEW
jgi:hypothetical protein